MILVVRIVTIITIASKRILVVIKKAIGLLIVLQLYGYVFLFPQALAESKNPTGTFTINNDAQYTSAKNITLNFSDVSSDVTSLEIRNGATGSFQNPVAYSNPYNYTLTTDEGTKTVSVRFSNSDGKKSTGIIKDTIVLDTTAPTTGDLGTDANWHKSDVVVTLSCADTLSGCSKTYYTIDGSIPTASSSAGNSITLKNSGIYTIKYLSYDNAGNSESVKTSLNTVKIDRSIPSAISDLGTAIKNTDLTIPASTLLSNDSDSNNDILTLSSVGNANNGKVSLKGSNIIFTPAKDFLGIADFDYIVTDGRNDSTGHVNIKVNPLINEAKQVLLEATTNVTSANHQVVLGSQSFDSTVLIPKDVTNATLDTSNLASVSGTVKTVTLSNNITVNAATTLGNIKMQIPSGIKIRGAASSWTTGLINAPTVQANSTVNIPSLSGFTTSTAGVVEVGFGDVALTFDKGVRILLEGHAGKLVGYDRDGSFTQITNICSSDTQAAGDSLNGGDCKIDVGSDLIVWTQHFTKFATYTQTETSSSSTSTSESGSTNSSSACGDTKPASAPILLSATPGLNEITLTWVEAKDPVSYYLVAYGLTSGQQIYGNPSIGGKGTTTYKINSLTGGKTYYFKIRAGNGCTPGDYSNELSGIPLGGIVSEPAENFALGILSDSAEVKNEEQENKKSQPDPVRQQILLAPIEGKAVVVIAVVIFSIFFGLWLFQRLRKR